MRRALGLTRKTQIQLPVPIPNRTYQELFDYQTPTEIKVRNWLSGLRQQDRFDDVETICIFLGYARSGHSVIGALLDAHPQVVIAHEADAMQMISNGFCQLELFVSLLRNSRNFAKVGRGWSGRSHAIASQWQGTFDKLLVIGDKKGGATTNAFRRDPDLLDKLQATIDKKLRIIHHVRNPYDMIATHCRVEKRTAAEDQDVLTLADHFETVKSVSDQLDSESLFEGRHEEFLSDPRSYLRKLCSFVEVECSQEYLQICTKIVHPPATPSRFSLEWCPELLDQVQVLIKQYDFLDGYQFERC